MGLDLVGLRQAVRKARSDGKSSSEGLRGDAEPDAGAREIAALEKQNAARLEATGAKPTVIIERTPVVDGGKAEMLALMQQNYERGFKPASKASAIVMAGPRVKPGADTGLAALVPSLKAQAAALTPSDTHLEQIQESAWAPLER